MCPAPVLLLLVCALTWGHPDTNHNRFQDVSYAQPQVHRTMRPSVRPGSKVPDFTLPTLHGSFFGPTKNRDIIFHAQNTQNLFSETMVNHQTSLKKLLELSYEVDSAHYVFLTFSRNARAYARDLKHRFRSAMATLNYNENIQNRLFRRLHFVTKSVQELDAAGLHWLSEVLSEWTYPIPTLNITETTDIAEGAHHTNWSIPCVQATRQVTQYVPFPSTKAYKLKASNCPATHKQGRRFSDKVALLPLSECDAGNTTYTLNFAWSNGASGVIVYPAEGDEPDFLHCEEINACYGVPVGAVSVRYEDAMKLKEKLADGRRLDVVRGHHFGPAIGFLVTYDGKLAQLGLLSFPRFDFYGYLGQWWDYRARLQRKINDYLNPDNTLAGQDNCTQDSANSTELEHHSSSIVVTLFTGREMGPAEKGTINATINMPDYDRMRHIVRRGGSVLIDFALGCPGWGDDQCPPWDRIVQMYVKCTGWEKEQEMGRWITPYHLTNGRWITNYTPLLPLLNATQCVWRLRTDPWIQAPWIPTVRLVVTPMYWAPSHPNVKISNVGQPEDVDALPLQPPVHTPPLQCHHHHHRHRASPLPFRVIPMYTDYFWFNQSYNSYFKPFHFNLKQLLGDEQVQDTRKRVKKVVVETTLTAHGNDNHGCAEFCATEHSWAINHRKPVFYNFTMMSTNSATGCTEYVHSGVQPNQYGTWLYGRNTWCPGEQVAPWVVDLTGGVRWNGDNVVVYKGYWDNGKVPDPQPGAVLPAFFTFTSSLVLFE